MAWTVAWAAMCEERHDYDLRSLMREKDQTVTVPLQKYCSLLEAAEREKICHVQLGEAQETIRVLRATVARQDELITLQQSAMERETQALIDRKTEKPAKAFC